MRVPSNLPGGRAAGMKVEDFDAEELAHGVLHELEHIGKRQPKAFEVALEIAADHLAEDQGYYTALGKMEESRKRTAKKKRQKKKPRFTLKRGGSSQRMNQMVRDVFRDIYER